MTHSQTKAWLWVVAIILLLMLLLSCGTKKTTITETIYSHDTVTVLKTDTVIKHHSDTVLDIKYVSTADSVKEKEYHTYILNNVGDTIREVHHYHNTEKTTVIDSTYKYKVELDSLRAVMERERQEMQSIYEMHEKVKTKKAVPWDIILLVVVTLFFSICAFWKGGTHNQ